MRLCCCARLWSLQCCRVCYRRIPQELIERIYNDPTWVAMNSVHTGEESSSNEDDGEVDSSDDSSSR